MPILGAKKRPVAAALTGGGGSGVRQPSGELGMYAHGASVRPPTHLHSGRSVKIGGAEGVAPSTSSSFWVMEAASPAPFASEGLHRPDQEVTTTHQYCPSRVTKEQSRSQRHLEPAVPSSTARSAFTSSARHPHLSRGHSKHPQSGDDSTRQGRAKVSSLRCRSSCDPRSSQVTAPRSTASGCPLASTGVDSGVYALQTSQHPLYAGKNANLQSHRPSPAISSRTTDNTSGGPPKCDAMAGLSISTDANTVRGLQKGNAWPAGHSAKPSTGASDIPARVDTSIGGPHTIAARRRGSVIQQLAAVTMQEGRETGFSPHPGALGARGGLDVRGRYATGSNKDDNGAPKVAWCERGDTQALGPLKLHERGRMYLQAVPSNMSAARGQMDLSQRVPSDALVLVSPEKTPYGVENAMYAQLKAFKMPHAEPATAPAPLPSHPAEGNGILPPPPPPALPSPPAATVPPPSGAPPGSTVSGVGSSATTAPSPLAPTSTPSSAPAPVSGAAEAPKASTSAPSAPSAPPPIMSAETAPNPLTVSTDPHTDDATHREPTTEEKVKNDEDRLLHDVIASSQPHLGGQVHRADVEEGSAATLLAQHPLLSERMLSRSLIPAGPVDHDLVVAVEAALRLRREANNGIPEGWRTPPSNVLLPDHTKPSSSWVLPASFSSQVAQQAAAVVTLARLRSHAHADTGVAKLSAEAGVAGTADHNDGPARKGYGDAVKSAELDCMDYHAPFLDVLHPEYVEHQLVPDALRAGAEMGPDIDDPTATTAAVETEVATGKGEAAAHAVHSLEKRGSTTVKSLAAQAVILREPLSLLACEQLASDTTDVIARRRAYLAAIDPTRGTGNGSGVLGTEQLGALSSILQAASPPGEVFCELSYPAKVLLSAVLYMRALGALPSLLRVGPLTEYSPVVDKENCIELVFYNPSAAEQEERAAQESEQQAEHGERLRRHSLTGDQMEGSLVVYNQPPVARSASRFTSSRDTLPQGPTSRLTEGRGAGLSKGSPRNPFRTPSLHANSSPLEDSLQRAQAAPHDAAGACNSLLQSDSALFPEGGRSHPGASILSQSSSNAIEGRLMQTLSTTAMRRSSSIFIEGTTADPARVASPRRSPSRTSFTTLAGTPLQSVEASVLADAAEEPLLAPGAEEGIGGTWLSRGGFTDSASRGRPQHPAAQGIHTSKSQSLGGEPSARGDSLGLHSSSRQQRSGQPVGPPPPQQQRRGSECSGNTAGRIPQIAVLGQAQLVKPNTYGRTAVPTSSGASTLRRSSVQMALKDLQQLALEEQAKAEAPETAPGSGKPLSPLSAPRKTMLNSATPAARLAASLSEVPAALRGARPANAAGPGASRFPKGEHELCVVLRAVIAQKSQAYAFGKGETVHVLPPLPPRDDGEDDTAVATTKKSSRGKTSELDRLAVTTSNPLFKLLSGESRKKDPRGRQTALRERAQRAAAAARQRGPITVNEDGMPSADDYGDLVVAFLLSGGASELSGSVPDMMELEELRYRIFSLNGYSVNDPSGMRAVKAEAAAEAAAAAKVSSAISTEPKSRRATQHTSQFDATPSGFQKQLASFTAFQTSALAEVPRASSAGLQRRPSFFESALRQTDPLADITEEGGNGWERGHYPTEFDVQQQRRKTQQQQSARPQLDTQEQMMWRYPTYRASSIAESTLQTFFAESRSAVMAAHRHQRHHDVVGGRRRASSSEHAYQPLSQRSQANLRKGTTTSPATITATELLLQGAERDLLHFRPMHLNSFHYELIDAVQYALDLQIRQGKENILQAFHM